eukprot:gnl/Trimastix_PCT/3522.p1 GENE.gnl/Trimastix_PCT/3522~~gnl/Trimastix_PCT/3522.p1  ORF type:complete len:380 (+),score=111.27 gnl/Trimastix_PCT/3522:41-1141(+)
MLSLLSSAASSLARGNTLIRLASTIATPGPENPSCRDCPFVEFAHTTLSKTMEGKHATRAIKEAAAATGIRDAISATTTTTTTTTTASTSKRPKPAPLPFRLGVIGAGNMSEAILAGAIRAGVIPANKILASDPSPERRKIFERLGMVVTNNNQKVIDECDQVMIGVKPQMYSKVFGPLKIKNPNQVFISMMAGITTKRLDEVLKRGKKVVRVMPNTPLQVGLGFTEVCIGGASKTADAKLAFDIFNAGNSKALHIKEAEMDSMTPISGSGPAYLFYLAESMEKAAQACGVAKGQARSMVAQTLLGASKLLSQSGESPAELRRKVTSPGGVTAVATTYFDDHDMKSIVVNALSAAKDKAVQFSKSE